MPRLSRLAAVLVLVATLMSPSVALAQQNPFSPLPTPSDGSQQQTQTLPETANNDTVDNGGLSTLQETLIFVVGVILVISIGVLIMRDARKRAPVSEYEATHRGEEKTRGTRTDPARRKQRNRSKGKAQRRARKSNR